MVYKAVQAFFSDRAQAFLPGSKFYPEEDKYASQFDPWSIGHRPVSRPWISISFKFEVLGWPEEGSEQMNSRPDSHHPAENSKSHDSSANSPPASLGSQRVFNGGIGSPEENTGVRMHSGMRQTAYDRIMGHCYGNSNVHGGSVHFGDNYYYHSPQSKSIARRNSDSAANMTKPFSFESIQGSTRPQARFMAQQMNDSKRAW